jgi:hypothetical protein
MTSLQRLLTCAVAGALVATVSCKDNGGSPVEPEPEPETADLLTVCPGPCIGGFVAMVDGFEDMMKLLVIGEESTHFEPFLNLETGVFSFHFDMDGEPGDEMEVRGTISPLEDRCNNGMFVDEVCIAEWDLWRGQLRMGEGTFSIVGLGDKDPDSMRSFRVTIVTENPWMETAEGCRLDITALQLIVHQFVRPPFDSQLMSAVVTFKMTVAGLFDELSGDLTYAYDPTATSQSMNLTGQYTAGGTTTNVSCTANLDPFEISCS